MGYISTYRAKPNFFKTLENMILSVLAISQIDRHFPPTKPFAINMGKRSTADRRLRVIHVQYGKKNALLLRKGYTKTKSRDGKTCVLVTAT